MAKILVIDDESIVREPLSASLRAQGHEVACAADARAARERVSAGKPDLIILDMNMPQENGLDLLRTLRGQEATADVPVIFLTGATEKSLVLQAAKLGVEGYILKSAFSLDELAERIQRLLKPGAVPPPKAPCAPPAAVKDSAPKARPDATPKKPGAKSPSAPDPSALPKLLTRDQTLERLEGIISGKTLAGTVSQLISVANSKDADVTDVVRVLESDPILAARVLQLANSASTGSRGRSRSVEDAVRNIGARGIYNMAVGIGIFGAFPADERDGFNTMRCWQHSFAVVEILARLLGRQTGDQESTNHLIGLCHDLGEILLRQHFADEYAQVLSFAQTHHLPVHQVESAALGIRHAEIIGRLLTRMSLPVPVVQGIREFHERTSRDQSAGSGRATQGLLLANLAAHGLLLAASTAAEVRPITRTEWRQFSADKMPPPFDPAALRSEILTTTNVLARLPAAEEERLLKPPIPHRSLRVGYCRPEHYVDFDPLGFALALTCNVKILPEAPQPPWDQFDALVVVGLRPDAVMTAELQRVSAKIPVLWLVAQAPATSCQGQLTLKTYPVSLDELGEWLGQVNPQAQSSRLQEK